MLSLFALSLAKVANIEVGELAALSSVIAVATVAEVETISGVKVASAVIERVFKGAPGKRVRFIAQPTWICDISAAVKGERILLFLNNIGNWTPPKDLDIRGASRTSDRAGEHLFVVSDSGRGRVVILHVGGVERAKVDRYDKQTQWQLNPNLLLPRGSAVLPTSAVSGSISLDALLKLLKLQSQRRSLVPMDNHV